MAERSFGVRLYANIAAYKRAMEEASRATSGLSKEVESGMARAGARMQDVGGKATTRLTLPLLAAGAGAVKLGNDFDSAFGQMVGLAGVAADEVDGLKESVLDLAGQTARSPQELAEALYFAASAGLDTAGAMDAVTVAARASAAGLGSTQDVVGLVASAIASYGSDVISAAEATDILTGAIRAGRAEPSELAGTLGRVLPIAASLGVQFDEVGGVVAYLSNVFGDTNRTVTATQGLLVKLASPTQQGRDALRDMGTSAEELQAAIDSNGLLGALELLRDRGFVGNQQAMAKLFDDIEGRQAAVALLEDNSGQLAGTLAEVADSAGATNEAFDALDEDTQRTRQAWVDIQVALIKVAEVIGPIVADIAGFISQLATAFADLPKPVQAVIVGFLGLVAAAGPVLWVAGSLLKNLREIRRAKMHLATASSGLARAMGPLTVALGAAGAAVVAYGIHQQRAAEFTQRATAAMGELSRVAEEDLGRTFAGMVKDFNMGGASMEEALASVARGNLEGAKRMLEHADAAGFTAEETRMLEQAIRDEEAALRQQTTTTEQYGDAQETTTTAVVDATEEQQRLAEETARLEEITREAEAATDVFGRTLGEMHDHSVDWQTALEEAGTAADDLRSDIESAFSGATTAISGFSDKAMEDVGLFVQELQDNAQAAFDWQNNLITIASATSGDFALYLAGMGEAGYGLVDDLANGAGPELESAFNAWVVATGVTQRDMVAEFAKVDPEFRKVIDGIPDSMSTTWQSIRAREKSEAEQTGRDIAAGLASGVNAKATEVAEATIQLVRNAVQAAKDAALIGSPSRLFRDEVGVWMAEGVAVGIAETGHRLSEEMVNAIDRAREDSVDAAWQLVDEVQAALDSIWSGIDDERRIEDLQLGVTEAEGRLSDARRAAAEAAAEFGVGSEEHAEALERVDDAQRRLEDSNYRLLRAQEEAFLAGEVSEDQYRRLAEAAGIELEAIDRLIGKLRELAEARKEADAQQTAIDDEAAAAGEIARKFGVWAGTGRWTQSVLDNVAKLQRDDPKAALAWMTAMVADAERDLAAWQSGIQGRAFGGPTVRGHLYEVAELGHPEMLTEGGRSYLIPGGSGNVTPLVPAPTVNVDVQQFTTEQMDRLADQFARRLASRWRQSGRAA